MTLLDRLMGRAPAQKAVYGGILASTYATDLPLTALGGNEQQRMAAYLKAYKVGWFYKGGHKIAGDIAGLVRTLAYEDTEGDNAEEIVAPPLMVPWEQLDPLEQFLRLMERPNPYQTGRTLFTKTEIRLDFTGAAFMYLEGGEGGQLPTGLYGISPTRMWPSLNARGRLIGWVMDKDDRGGGVPFTTDEILPFIVPGSDEDIWYGQGVVEAVYANVPLSTALAKHTGTVLTLGGRLAGMMWPRERTLSEDEYIDAQRAWRNVASDPDAAKRMLIFPEPMEYAAGAATPQEIGIPELAVLTRDEILTAFPISPYQLGVPMPGGLNSAMTRQEDRRDYWEGSIHPRVELLEETIQWGLINRYEEAVGRSLDFDIEEPNLDDAAKIIEKVGALKGLVSVGFDPKESIAAVGLDQIKWTTLPALLDPAKQAEMAAQAAAQPSEQANVTVGDRGGRATVAEPVSKAIKALKRDEVIGQELPGFNDTMRQFLDDQAVRISADIARTLDQLTKAQRKAAPDVWWNQEREDGLLREALRGLYVRLARTALGTVADTVDRIVYPRQVKGIVERMLTEAAQRITGINETTRDAVAQHLAVGAARGYSISQIANGFTSADATESFPGLRTLPAFDDARAELVARTETMLGYNKSALLGYQEYDVTMVEAIDGDQDEECAARDGQTFTLEEALDIEDHPNGTLDWVPLSDKAAHEMGQNRQFLAAIKAVAERPTTFNVYPSEVTVTPTEPAAVNVTVPTPSVTIHEANPAIVNVNVPKQDAPTVNVAPSVTVVPAPVVNVTNASKAPDINVTVTPELRITSMPDRRTERVVERDKAGRITRTLDAETDA